MARAGDMQLVDCAKGRTRAYDRSMMLTAIVNGSHVVWDAEDKSFRSVDQKTAREVQRVASAGLRVARPHPQEPEHAVGDQDALSAWCAMLAAYPGQCVLQSFPEDTTTSAA